MFNRQYLNCMNFKCSKHFLQWTDGRGNQQWHGMKQQQQPNIKDIIIYIETKSKRTFYFLVDLLASIMFFFILEKNNQARIKRRQTISVVSNRKCLHQHIEITVSNGSFIKYKWITQGMRRDMINGLIRSREK